MSVVGLATDEIRNLVHSGWSAAAQRKALSVADAIDRLAGGRAFDATDLALAIARTPRGASGNVEYAERLYAQMIDTETPKPPDDTPAEPADDPIPEPTEDPEVEPKP